MQKYQDTRVRRTTVIDCLALATVYLCAVACTSVLILEAFEYCLPGSLTSILEAIRPLYRFW